MSNSPEKLLALINADNPYKIPVSLSNVTLGAPVSISDPSTGGPNTKITVSSLPGHGFYGDVDVVYHRLWLGELGTLQLFSETEQFTAETILSMINAEKGTDFLPSDVVIEPELQTLTTGDMQTVVFTMNSDSVDWVGANEISLLFGLPENINELHQVISSLFPSGGYFN